MSVDLLETTEAHLSAGNLLDGYSVLYFRWSDDDLNRENEPFVTFRSSGGGLTDPVGGVAYPDIQIFVVGTVSTQVDTNRRAHEIRDYLIDNHRSGDVLNFQSLSDVIGPLFLNQNRPAYEINIRATSTRLAS